MSHVTELLIRNDLWVLHCHAQTSYSRLWFSHLYAVVLKNQKCVFH